MSLWTPNNIGVRKSLSPEKEATLPTSTSSQLEDDHSLIIYSRFASSRSERKKLPFILIVSLLFFPAGIAMIVAGKGRVILDGWGVVLFFGLSLGFSLTQLIWGPLLVLNHQGIRVRPRLFLRSISLRWDEIAVITSVGGTRKSCLGFTLSPEHLETFLQRQSPLTKKILERRMKRFHVIALLPQWLLPYSRTALLVNIQERYHVQLQQYHILLETHAGHQRSL